MKITRLRFLVVLLVACVGVLLILQWLERLNREPDNYSLIEPGLYMGGRVSQPPSGTRAVLNLCEHADPYQCEAHLWEPIPDAEPAPSIDWLRRMVQFIDQQQKAGLMTYVHCFAGVSRSGMVMTAYLMFKNDWTRDQALEFVRSMRQITRPNPAFMERLSEWERVLKGSPAARQ
jgi:hypothetical protein